MAETKTGLEPPTSVLTADVPTIRASHLLFHIMHQSTYITNQLVVPFYKPNRHACKSLYVYYYTPTPNCSCMYMYILQLLPTSFITSIILTQLLWLVRKKSRGHKVALNLVHLFYPALRETRNKEQLFNLWEVTCRASVLTIWLKYSYISVPMVFKLVISYSCIQLLMFMNGEWHGAISLHTNCFASPCLCKLPWCSM